MPKLAELVDFDRDYIVRSSIMWDYKWMIVRALQLVETATENNEQLSRAEYFKLANNLAGVMPYNDKYAIWRALDSTTRLVNSDPPSVPDGEDLEPPQPTWTVDQRQNWNNARTAINKSTLPREVKKVLRHLISTYLKNGGSSTRASLDFSDITIAYEWDFDEPQATISIDSSWDSDFSTPGATSRVATGGPNNGPYVFLSPNGDFGTYSSTVLEMDGTTESFDNVRS